MKIVTIGRGTVGGGLAKLWRTAGTRSMSSAGTAGMSPPPTSC